MGAYTHFIAQSIKDTFNRKIPISGNDRPVVNESIHFEAAVNWLMKSIKQANGEASAKAYRFMNGWMTPYPETSGYIIPTLIALSNDKQDESFKRYALQIGLWLENRQTENGGFVGREVGALDTPIIFDTGMILHGFISLIRDLKEERYIKPAKRAADFLVGSMDDNGCFVKNLSNDIIHTYNVRAAWALISLSGLISDNGLKEAALKNAHWAVSQQLANGYYRHNNFKPNGNANLHGTAYVMRGLLEIYKQSGETKLLNSVILAADKLIDLYNENGYIAGELGENWEYLYKYTCLTGYAQTAIILFKLYQQNGEKKYYDTAVKLIEDVCLTQNITNSQAEHFGAIAGSHPIYGRYAPLQYPNWATKFFIDAILEKKKITQ